MEQTSQTQEIDQTPLMIIEDYLGALRGTDITEYERVEGITNRVVWRDPRTSESHTFNVIRQAQIYELEPTQERLGQLNSWRTASAIHVVRGMIQGKQIPIEEFEPIIDEVIFTVNAINGFEGQRKARHLLRSEIRNVWGFKSMSDPEYMRRTAEAYKLTGRPLVFGEALIKLAGISYTQY